MNILSHKDVITRKKHRCNACLRTFPAGTKMNVQTVANEGTIYNWYACQTCEELMAISNDLDDGYGEYEQGCVDNALNVGQTPEEMLEECKKYRHNEKANKRNEVCL